MQDCDLRTLLCAAHPFDIRNVTGNETFDEGSICNNGINSTLLSISTSELKICIVSFDLHCSSCQVGYSCVIDPMMYMLSWPQPSLFNHRRIEPTRPSPIQEWLQPIKLWINPHYTHCRCFICSDQLLSTHCKLCSGEELIPTYHIFSPRLH